MKPPILLLPLACLLMLAVGCSPKTPPTPTPATVATKPPGGNAQVPPAPPQVPAPAAPPVAVAPSVPAPVPVAVRPFDESLLRGREFLLEAPSARQFVRDPDLGVLGTDSAVARVAEAFFRGARTGKLDVATLAPRWAAYLQAWAKRYQTSGVGDGKTVRVGVGITGEEGVLLVPVRLNGGGSSLQGWLALVRQGDTWLVSDVQVVESVNRTGPFDPESPSQEISSPSLR